MARSFTRYIKVYLISPDTGLLSSILIQRTAFTDHTRRREYLIGILIFLSHPPSDRPHTLTHEIIYEMVRFHTQHALHDSRR